jgi:hypothetical protein
MIEHSKRLRFALEPRHAISAERELGRKDLDHDSASCRARYTAHIPPLPVNSSAA